MRGKKALALVIIASMLLTVVPIFAWEYSNTNLGSDGKYRYKSADKLVQPYGPRVDKIQIIMYSDELAEFTALEKGEIDLTDWPVDTTHFVPWTTSPLNATVAVIDTGPEFGMFLLDINNNPNAKLPDGTDNPAYIAGIGNPTADVNLRRAIAHCINRTWLAFAVVSGGNLPMLGSEMYTPVGEAYGDWQHPEIKPGGAREDLTYPFNITKANQILDAAGYTYTGSGKRTKGGVPFKLEMVVREDHTPRREFGKNLWKYLTDPIPSGLQLDVDLQLMRSAGARAKVMADKDFHMYTGGWGLGADPDQLYYLWHKNLYWHPGRPMNYAYYGGSEAANNNKNVSDYGWGLMTSLTYAQALDQAWKCQKAIAQRVNGAPLYCSKSYTAFKRTYAGNKGPTGNVYVGMPWKGVVNTAGTGVWGFWSQYNMHPFNVSSGKPAVRNGNMTLTWGFRQPTMSLNPIYAEWVWDWYVLGRSYDSVLGQHPYSLADVRALANNWKIETWNATELGLGICTKITFNLRHDAYWSDGVQLTSSDVKFTWGGPKVVGSISNLLDARGSPPPYWGGQIADILSITTPDPFTVIVYLDIMAYFGLHSMSGFNLVMPEHVWRPLILDLTYPIEQPFSSPGKPVPNVVSGPYIITDTSDPAARRYIMLEANKKHYELDRPINIWTYQLPTTYTIEGNPFESVGQLHPLTTGTTADVYVDVMIHNKYFHETGPYNATVIDEKIFPLTELDGTKNVSLWKWNKNGYPGYPLINYTKVGADLVSLARWNSTFCKTHTERVHLGLLTAGFYVVKVDVHIDSLKIYSKTSGTWITLDPADNPWYCKKITYYELIIVTKLTDVGGINYKHGTAEYQPVPDLKVDMVDMYEAAKAFGAYPGHWRWSTAADINADNKNDMIDMWNIARTFGWVAP